VNILSAQWKLEVVLKTDGTTFSSDPGRTRSVQRALSLLEILGSYSRSVGISELSSQVELPVSTVHRLLATLVDAGFVFQNSEDGKYQVGLRAFQVGRAYLHQTTLLDVARLAMRELSSKSGESVNLAVRDGNYAVYVDQVESYQVLKLFTRTGSRVSLHCTGVGKVFLASFSRDEVEAYLSETELVPRTPNTIADPDTLRPHLENIRKRGYAIDDEEFEVGVRCVAAPIYDYRDEVVAALSVSGPAQRVTRSSVIQIAELVTEAANNISRQLGYSAGINLGRS
jgi:DNA-binding IclR family transcriptional regulator